LDRAGSARFSCFSVPSELAFRNSALGCMDASAFLRFRSWTSLGLGVLSLGTPIVFVLRVSWLRFMHVHEILYIWRSPGSLAVCARARTGFSVSLMLNSEALFFRRGNQLELRSAPVARAQKPIPCGSLGTCLFPQRRPTKRSSQIIDWWFLFSWAGEEYRTFEQLLGTAFRHFIRSDPGLAIGGCRKTLLTLFSNADLRSPFYSKLEGSY